jgi:type II secretory pathway pseudopilin PulG
MKPRSGLTLIELIIFVAIFAVSMGAIMGVFTNISAVAVRQSSVAEVQGQSQFLLQTIQYYVERSSVVSTTVDEAVSTLTLRMPAPAEDPVVIDMNGNAVRLKIGAAAAQNITSDKVEVSGLSFSKRSNPGGKDSVATSFTVTYATGNQAQRFAQSLRTAIARVSAATFDSDIVPGAASAGDYALGTSAGDWRSVNNTLFFNGSNVGIGDSTPDATFEVAGGNMYVSDSGAGIIFKNGSSCHLLYLTADGGIATSSLACP